MAGWLKEKLHELYWFNNKFKYLGQLRLFEGGELQNDIIKPCRLYILMHIRIRSCPIQTYFSNKFTLSSSKDSHREYGPISIPCCRFISMTIRSSTDEVQSNHLHSNYSWIPVINGQLFHMQLIIILLNAVADLTTTTIQTTYNSHSASITVPVDCPVSGSRESAMKL